MKKTIALILALLMFVAFSACGGDTKTAPDVGTQDIENTAAPEGGEDVQTGYSANIPDDTDYQGRAFTVYAYDPYGESNITWYDADFSATEENGEILNDAVYQRMVFVEEKYNVDVISAQISGSGSFAKLKKSVTAGDGAYDIAFLNSRDGATAAQGGYLINLAAINNMQLDQPWWDQNSVKEMSYMNQLYLITGDIGTMYKKSIGVLLFNKQMTSSYGLDSPYELVSSNTWTIDKFVDMSITVSEDLNGDGKMDQSDKFGLLYYCDFMALGLIGADIKFTTKNADDIPELTFMSDKTVSAFEKYTKILFDPNLSLSWSKIGVPNEDLMAMFSNNQGLFQFNEFHSITHMRTMDADFGILPVPLYDEAQSRYYHTINPHVAAMFCIAKDVKDIDFSVNIANALAAESKNVLTPAYNEVYLKYKGARDNESEAILDLVFSTLRYDLGYLNNWGNIGGFTLSMTNAYQSDLTSRYAKLESKVITAKEKATSNYEELAAG